MKKKQNVFKRKRDFHFLSIFSSIFFSALLLLFFILIGYSVARPFGEIGEAKNSSLVVDFGIEETTKERTEPDAVKAYWLAESEIKDIDTLERMLDRADDSYNTAVIPMKIKGGKLNYTSYTEGASLAEASIGPELQEIISTVKSHGLKPAASLNTMSDNLYPKADNTAGFVYKKGGKLWYDAAEKIGGKSWLSPSSPSAKAYLSSLTAEIAAAGFEFIIATDAQFPKFSRIGLDDIGEAVTNENRYLDLIDTVNQTAAAADTAGRDMWLEVSAAEIFSGTCEVYQPLMLETDKTVLKINFDDFKSTVKCGDENIDFSKLSITEKTEKICDIAETYIYKTSFIPEITGTLSTSEKNEAVEALEGMEYYSYIIR